MHTSVNLEPNKRHPGAGAKNKILFLATQVNKYYPNHLISKQVQVHKLVCATHEHKVLNSFPSPILN